MKCSSSVIVNLLVYFMQIFPDAENMFSNSTLARGKNKKTIVISYFQIFSCESSSNYTIFSLCCISLKKIF